MLTPQALPLPWQTPLLRAGAVWVKPEGRQVTESVKYRLVYAKVTAAMHAGLLDKHSVLTEVTSGSTGVALAYVGALLGVRVELHAYINACPRKCARIQSYGVELVLHAPDTPMSELLDQVACRVMHQGYWHLNQYHRPSTMAAYQALGHEIVGQLTAQGAPLPQFFACAVGTGGLIQGVGAYLRQVLPALTVVAVEPEPQVTIQGMRNTHTLHLGQDDPYELAFPDLRLTTMPPREPARVAGITLGESATAVYNSLKQMAWEDVLLIAAD